MYALKENVTYINTGSNYHEQLNLLKTLCHQHPLWKNPLIIAAETGTLKFEDMQFLFGQYYLYSKNFSRFIAAVMANCESDYYRSKLAENLWEESGEKELENRHAEIFRQFLTKGLGLELSNIEFEEFTKNFVNQYMALCMELPALEASAVLSLGTEGIVSTLYTKLKIGLLAAGFKDVDLLFFNIHIECDDAHAATLEEIVLSYSHEKNWFERCKQAMLAALDLRHQFFNDVYMQILQRNMQPLLVSTAYKPTDIIKLYADESLVSNINLDQNILYHNQDETLNINFKVQRVPVNAEVLDPRVVTIPAGFQNEFHEHAHETIFLILEGEGEVQIGERIIRVQAQSVVYVPRWVKHQTKNIGSTDLKFFAITDYGLTKRFPINSESVYRGKKENVGYAVTN